MLNNPHCTLQNRSRGTLLLHQASSTDSQDTQLKDKHRPKDRPLQVTQPKDKPLRVTLPKDKPLWVTLPKDKPQATRLQELRQHWQLTWEPRPPSLEPSLLPSHLLG